MSEGFLNNMAGNFSESRPRTTSSEKRGGRTGSRSRFTAAGSLRSTSSRSRRRSESASDDGLTAAERRRLSRPFAPSVLARAREIAQQYRLVIEADDEVGFFGCTVEMPLVMADGRTVQACARNVLDATIASVATLLERDERPPSPAREARRDQQINIRLSAEEKLRLEGLAAREGFRSISDFVRSSALDRE